MNNIIAFFLKTLIISELCNLYSVRAVINDWPSDHSEHLKDGCKFDYIVVGAGASGCATAYRLALAGFQVLLIEAGGNPNFVTEIPGLAAALMGSSMDWQYKTEPNGKSCLASKNKSCRFSRGKCLGGSTSINAMIYTRGIDKDFDDWGVPYWTWKEMMPYFLKYEGLQDLKKLPPSSKPYHNTTGIMKVEFAGPSGNIWHDRIFQGFEALNISFNPDVNAHSQIGVTKVTTFTHDGKRMSTALAYLTDIKSNLFVAKDTTVTKVIIDCDGTAIGVNIVTKLFNRRITVFVKKEVVLSAGTIGTAHILLSSGIGPKDHLKEYNVPVHSDLPVGNNMSDHVLPLMFAKVNGDDNDDIFPDIFFIAEKGIEAINWLLTNKGPLASLGLTDVTAFCNTECYDYDNHTLTADGPNCHIPNMQVILSYLDKGLIPKSKSRATKGLNLNKYTMDQISKANEDNSIIIFTPIILRPTSKGSIRLTSSNPEDPPKIFPNYIGDEKDLNQMLQNIKVIKDLLNTSVMKNYNARLLTLNWPECNEDVESDDYWRCYAQHMTYSVFHAVGTASLGSVVDWRLRVIGVNNLRVADASVVPILPRGNTAALIIAIGERAADFLLEDND